MASIETQNEVNDLSKKIDAALDLCNNCKVVAGTKNESQRNFKSFQAMYDAYMLNISKLPSTFIDVNEVVIDLIGLYKSKCLTSDKLVEALIYSKTFEESEYEKNCHQHKGELVWVGRDGGNVYLVVVSQNLIIYHVTKVALKQIRQIAQTIKPVLKKRIKNNLIDSFSTSELTPDWSKYTASLQSSFDAAVCNNATSDRYHVQYPLTEEVKKVMLDEVNSLNLDPRIKQQFVFDLKVLPEKDLLYWRDRVDCLRFSSNSAFVSPPEQAVADHKVPVKVVEEKANEKLQELVENISRLQETVNRNELYLAQLVEQKLNDGSSNVNHEMLQPRSLVISSIESNLVRTHVNKQEGSSEEESNELLETASDISNLVLYSKSSLQAVEDQVKKLDGTVSSLCLCVTECTDGVKKNSTLLNGLDRKMDSPRVTLPSPSTLNLHAKSGPRDSVRPHEQYEWMRSNRR